MPLCNHFLLEMWGFLGKETADTVAIAGEVTCKHVDLFYALSERQQKLPRNLERTFRTVGGREDEAAHTNCRTCIIHEFSIGM